MWGSLGGTAGPWAAIGGGRVGRWVGPQPHFDGPRGAERCRAGPFVAEPGRAAAAAAALTRWGGPAAAAPPAAPAGPQPRAAACCGPGGRAAPRAWSPGRARHRIASGPAPADAARLGAGRAHCGRAAPGPAVRRLRGAGLCLQGPEPRGRAAGGLCVGCTGGARRGPTRDPRGSRCRVAGWVRAGLGAVPARGSPLRWRGCGRAAQSRAEL